MVTIENQNINVAIYETPVIARIDNQNANIEISNRNGVDSDLNPTWITFTSGFNFLFDLAALGLLNFNNILFFNVNLENISISYKLDTIYLNVESNIDLLNHKMLIT